MSLSEHELRVLHEIEQELERLPSSRLSRLGRFLADHRAAILVSVVAVGVIVLLALFATGVVAAPLAGAAGVAAGFAVRGRRCWPGLPHRRRNPG